MSVAGLSDGVFHCVVLGVVLGVVLVVALGIVLGVVLGVVNLFSLAGLRHSLLYPLMASYTVT